MADHPESGGLSKSKITKHVTGTISFRCSSGFDTIGEFHKFERLIQRERCLSVLDDPGLEDAIQGQRSIYRIFSDVVEYGNMFQGLRKLVGKNGKESAGRVVRTVSQESWLDFTMVDCFCQVAGIFINSMTERLPDDMYISDKIEQHIRSPRWSRGRQRPDMFEVYASHHRPSNKECLSDIFVFDPSDGSLVEVIFGVHYRRISKTAFKKALTTSGSGSSGPTSELIHASTLRVPEIEFVQANENCANSGHVPSKNELGRKASYEYQHGRGPSILQAEIASGLRNIIASLSGLDTAAIRDEAQLVDLSIDSLMGMELSREIENAFKCSVHATLATELTDFRSLVKWVEDALGTAECRSNCDTEVSNSDLIVPRVNGRIPPRETTKGGRASQNGLLRLVGDGDHDETPDVVLRTFRDYSQLTDTYIKENGLASYIDEILPLSDELCITLLCDAFERLGCHIRSAGPGQKLARVKCLPRHEAFVALAYEVLDLRAGLIKLSEVNEITRTQVHAPRKSAHSVLQELNHKAPSHLPDHNLTALVGNRLVEMLLGKEECAQLIFGPEARQTVSAMYSQSPVNAVWIKQMHDFISALIPRLAKRGVPIKILELGAGTGGTTSRMVPLLASLQPETPIEYTVTDVSSSLVAAAKQRFNQYSFVQCQILDIEKNVISDHLHNYDIVLATNCVHATRSLEHSTRNIRKMLRPDGFLLLLEMTQSLLWVDFIFGLIEGWWLFDDGRKHALASPAVWEKTLQTVGFECVEWTSGELPESRIQRLILAMPCSARIQNMCELPSFVSLPRSGSSEADVPPLQTREQTVNHFVEQYTASFGPNLSHVDQNEMKDLAISSLVPVVLVTGATGSLGSHLLQQLSSLSEVGMVICLNRTSSLDAQSRQEHALSSKDISVNSHAISKWRVFQTDTHKPFLGLSGKDYQFLAQNVTHIVHNAWPMSIRRPIHDFESQFKVMRNLIDVARQAHASHRRRINFQFVSSIAVVGLHPLRTGEVYAPEEPVSVDSVLPNGYGEAKLVCERILAKAVEIFPEVFNSAMTVRIGQIAGSKITGYWNPVEHFAFMMKSSQTLGCLPDLKGTLSWCPVDDVAAVLVDLLLSQKQKHGIYHIENPVRQDWETMIRWLSAALDVHHVVPYKDWVTRVCYEEPASTADQQAANPAARLADFLENNFARMSCGGLILSTKKSQAGSDALKRVGAVDENLVKKYVMCWKQTGLLRL